MSSKGHDHERWTSSKVRRVPGKKDKERLWCWRRRACLITGAAGLEERLGFLLGPHTAHHPSSRRRYSPPPPPPSPPPPPPPPSPPPPPHWKRDCGSSSVPTLATIHLPFSLSLLRPPMFHHSNYCADGTVRKKKLLVGVEVAAGRDEAGRQGHQAKSNHLLPV